MDRNSHSRIRLVTASIIPKRGPSELFSLAGSLSPVLGLVLAGYLFLIIMAASVRAQWTMGARSVAMAQAHSALPSDTWAVFHNPAALNPNEFALGFFAIRYYGLRELEDHAVTLSMPLQRFVKMEKFAAVMAAGVHTYGFDIYRRTQTRIGLAVQFNRFRVGFTANYAHLQIKGYGSRGSPLFDTGIIAKITDSFRVGYRMSNLFNTGNGGSEADIYPAEMSGGFSWAGIPGLLITADLVKDLLYPVSLRSGVEAQLPGGLFLRGGWTAHPFTWSAGAGIHIARFRGNLAVQRHEVLGMSPGIDFHLNL